MNSWYLCPVLKLQSLKCSLGHDFKIQARHILPSLMKGTSASLLPISSPISALLTALYTSTPQWPWHRDWRKGQRLSAVLARPCLLAETGWQELKRRQSITLLRLGPGKDQARCDLDQGGIQLWMTTGSARLLSLSNVITWCCTSFNIALLNNGHSSPNGCCNLRTIYSYDSF